MRILGIDPGSMESAYCVLEHKTMKVEDKGRIANVEMMQGFMGDSETFFNNYYDVVVIEFPVPRGQLASKDLFETIFWIGRFSQACDTEMLRMDRKDVKINMCETMKAKDSNIRAACISRFEHLVVGRKGKCPVIGAGGCEGPLYGVVKDIWSALAICLTYKDQLGKESLLKHPSKAKYRRTARAYTAKDSEVFD